MKRKQGVRVAAVALAAALLTCCSAGAGSGAGSPSPSGSTRSAPSAPPTPTQTPNAGVGVPIATVLVQDGGLKLTTQTLGGGCRHLTLQAQESATEVRLTLTLTRPSGICPPYVTLVEVTTTLHAPLGSRHLVDATTGRPITPQVH